ncbi:hypothetical protein AVEN_217662-1 [Araneus ventricosus]|uniref:Uncharacterized protein n=1 Tax=Araneus ventricosus TaxID=182803 RepID=A0A4Y2HJV7_ARAVE|nr:hypothetical protein AVEN_217662-1 [Araneus ventricosus]
MSSEERQKAVQNSRSCFLCLDRRHLIAKCRGKNFMYDLWQKHPILLCRNIQVESKSPVSVKIRKDESKETIPQLDETFGNLARTPNVLLQTLMVTLRGRDMTSPRKHFRANRFENHSRKIDVDKLFIYHLSHRV